MARKHIVDGSTPLRQFALQQIGQRLTKLSKEAVHAAKSQDEEAIHDLRVSMRRFTQGLILFPEFLPAREVKKIRRRLKRMMNLTSEVRNRDIALEHLKESQDTALKQRLRQEREVRATHFTNAIGKWNMKDFAARWRVALELETL